MQVIDLVLKQAPHQIGGLNLDHVAINIETAHQHVFWAQNLGIETRQAQASLVEQQLATALDDLGVDDDHLFIVDFPDEDLLLNANLRGGETDAVVAGV